MNDDDEDHRQISGGPNTPKATAVYGNLYVAGYGGAIQAINLKTGHIHGYTRILKVDQTHHLDITRSLSI